MTPVKFAAIFMGNDFSPKNQHCYFQNTRNHTHFFGVKDLDEACSLARQLQAEGYQCIELCGAFTESGAKAVIAATDNKLAVGYSIHLPEQDELFAQLFG